MALMRLVTANEYFGFLVLCMWVLVLLTLTLAAVFIGVYVVTYSRRSQYTETHWHPVLAGTKAGPLLIANGGAPSIFPHNSLMGFHHAVSVGADVLYLQVRRTSDGELVVVAEEGVDRWTNGGGMVSDLTFRKLKLLDSGYRFTVDGGRTFPFRGVGIRVPTLREVMLSCPNTRLCVHVPGDQEDVADVVCQVFEDICKYKAGDRVIIRTSSSSSYRNALNRLHKRHQSTSSAGSEHETQALVESKKSENPSLSMLVRSATYVEPDCDVMQVPPAIFYDMLSLDSAAFVRAVHAANMMLFLELDGDDEVNMSEYVIHLAKSKVDGIVTKDIDSSVKACEVYLKDGDVEQIEFDEYGGIVGALEHEKLSDGSDGGNVAEDSEDDGEDDDSNERSTGEHLRTTLESNKVKSGSFSQLYEDSLSLPQSTKSGSISFGHPPKQYEETAVINTVFSDDDRDPRVGKRGVKVNHCAEVCHNDERPAALARRLSDPGIHENAPALSNKARDRAVGKSMLLTDKRARVQEIPDLGDLIRDVHAPPDTPLYTKIARAVQAPSHQFAASEESPEGPA